MAGKRNGKRKGTARAGVVAVSIGGPHVRVLQASARGEDVVVQARGAALAGTDDEGVAKSVVQALADAGIGERRVVVCLPAQAMTLKRVKVPPAREEQMEALVRFEAQRHLPLPPDQLAVGYVPLTLGGAQTEHEILLAVARRDDLARLEKALAASGVTVEGYGVDALAVADSYLHAAGASLNGAAHLLVAGEGGSVHAQVFQGGNLLFTRSLDAEEADWPADLRRSLTAYGLEHPDAPIYDAALIGEADEDGVARAVGSPVRRQDLKGVDGDGWAGAQGVARQWLGLGRYPLELEPQGWARSEGSAGRLGVLIGALAVLGLLALLVVWRMDRQKTLSRETVEAGRVVRATEGQRKLLAGMTRERDELREQLAEVAGSRTGPPLEVFREVSSRAPEGVWLTGLTYQDGRPLQIQGSSRTAAEATDFLRALESIPGFARAELGYLRSATIDEQPVTQFQINLYPPLEEPEDEVRPATALPGEELRDR